MRILLALIASIALLGCAKTETFDISVKNDASRPITLWLTKEGGKPVKGWRSPEDLAINTLADDEKVGGVIVQPGKTAESGPVLGKFESGSFPNLRIYAGENKFSDLLGISRGSPNRIEYPVSPGKTDLVVKDASARLSVERRE